MSESQNADEGRELVKRLRAISAPGSGIAQWSLEAAGWIKDSADLIERQAARESDRARVDAEDAHREDMANVGESLIEAIEDNRSHPLLKHWMPADGPAEIVADLLNAYDDRTAILDTAKSALIDREQESTRDESTGK